MQPPIVKFDGPHSFLSNKHPSTFDLDGVRYRSVSHAYYCLRAKDPEEGRRLLSLPIDEAIRLGKLLMPRDDWQSASEKVMLRLLRQKFESPFLGHLLLETGDQVLGDGRNFTGRLLMQVRRELKGENQP